MLTIFNDDFKKAVIELNLLVSPLDTIEVLTIEECSELVKEVTKILRGHRRNDELIEELSHVIIMCVMMIDKYDISESLIFNELSNKLEMDR